MHQLAAEYIEEVAGAKIYVEYVSKLSSAFLFRIHMLEGAVLTFTSNENTLEEAKNDVINSFKEFLLGG